MTTQMNGTIVVDFDEEGSPTFDAQNFVGGVCKTKLKPYEEAFGVTDGNRKARLTEKEKPELRQVNRASTRA